MNKHDLVFFTSGSVCLDPSGQRRPMRNVQSPTWRARSTRNSNRCSCMESLAFWCDQESILFFLRFIRVLEFSPIVTNAIPKAIVFPYIFYSLHKICVFFPQFGINNIQYGDGNHLSTVRTRDSVMYLFPLAGTLRIAWLTAACQYGLTCHGFQTNHALHFLG